MKKSVILTSVIAFISLLGTTTYAIVDNTTTSTDPQPTLVATTTDLGKSATTPVVRDETVYAITDPSGVTTKTYIGNTINTSDKALPVSLSITYTLDDTEISAAEIAGKSGRVKLTFTHTSTVTYLDHTVPFVALTGLTLDNTKFTNITTENGKILATTDDSTIIAGYSLVGLNENLGTDLLPDSFSVTADVTNFELGTTYTVFTNDLLADLDTSKLTSIDSIISSINQLGDGLNQIISGSRQLTDGLSVALTGTSKLSAGATQLSNGANDLATGAGQLRDGLNQLVEVDDTVINTIESFIPDDLDKKKAELLALLAKLEEYDVDTTPVLELLSIVETKITEVKSAVTDYTDGVKALAAGASQLADGSTALAGGINELKSGIDTLHSGISDLHTGASQLTDGLNTFKASGIDKLTNFANNDLASFTYHFRSSIDAARSYHNYSIPTAKSVKFIFKTPSIK